MAALCTLPLPSPKAMSFINLINDSIHHTYKSHHEMQFSSFHSLCLLDQINILLLHCNNIFWLLQQCSVFPPHPVYQQGHPIFFLCAFVYKSQTIYIWDFLSFIEIGSHWELLLLLFYFHFTANAFRNFWLVYESITINNLLRLG